MENSSHSESLILFDESIKRRPKDQYMARTFGMNFIDYFPHREKGITLFHLKQYQQAQNELLTSIQYKPTDKAKHFLNKTRNMNVIVKTSILDYCGPSINGCQLALCINLTLKPILIIKKSII